MTFKGKLETLSETLSEAELDGISGGRIKLERPERTPGTNGGGGGEPIDARWSQHPIFLGPF